MKPDRSSRIAGAVLGSFAGDALALGAHWIYEPAEIEKRFGRITDFVDPADNKYHGHRKPGEFTHYGDQALELMRSLEPGQGFSIDAFKILWIMMWDDYSGYVDGATKATLEQGGSDSNELGGASRIAPLIAALADAGAAELMEAAKAQTAFTHGDPGVSETAAFFALLTRKLLDDADFETALKAAVAQDFQHIGPAQAIKEARRDRDADTVAAMKARGLDCHLPSALPATLYLILKHGDSLEEALIENTMAGGDSAARGLCIGMVLGAKLGWESIPERWIDGMKAGEEISDWVAAQGG